MEQSAILAYPQLSANTTTKVEYNLLKAFQTANYCLLITLRTDGGSSWHINMFSTALYKTYMVLSWASANTSIATMNGRFNYVAQGY